MKKVHVMLADSEKAHTYEGDYDVALVGGCIVVSENLAVVMDHKGNPEAVIRTIYNTGEWTQVACPG